MLDTPIKRALLLLFSIFSLVIIEILLLHPIRKDGSDFLHHFGYCDICRMTLFVPFPICMLYWFWAIFEKRLPRIFGKR